MVKLAPANGGFLLGSESDDNSALKYAEIPQIEQGESLSVFLTLWAPLNPVTVVGDVDACSPTTSIDTGVSITMELWVDGDKQTERTECVIYGPGQSQGLNYNIELSTEMPDDISTGSHTVEVVFENGKSDGLCYSDEGAGDADTGSKLKSPFTVRSTGDTTDECSSDSDCPDGMTCRNGDCWELDENPPSNGDGNNGTNGDGNGPEGDESGFNLSGQQLLLGLLGAGFYARQKDMSDRTEQSEEDA